MRCHCSCCSILRRALRWHTWPISRRPARFYDTEHFWPMPRLLSSARSRRCAIDTDIHIRRRDSLSIQHISPPLPDKYWRWNDALLLYSPPFPAIRRDILMLARTHGLMILRQLHSLQRRMLKRGIPHFISILPNRAFIMPVRSPHSPFTSRRSAI